MFYELVRKVGTKKVLMFLMFYELVRKVGTKKVLMFLVFDK